MKPIIIAGIILLTFFVMVSCSKNSPNVSVSVATVAGIWSVVNDSGFAGVGLNNHAVDYAGRIGDYFDFRADGNIYVKEGPVSDTLQYTITSGSTMQISFFSGVSHITNLTNHILTIDTYFFYSPGGSFGRKVQLRR